MLEAKITIKAHNWTALTQAAEKIVEHLGNMHTDAWDTNEGAGIYRLEVRGEESAILIYEDNAGSCFLVQQSSMVAYQDDPLLTGVLANEDAEAIDKGDTENWSPDWIHRFPNQDTLQMWLDTMTHIATWYPDRDMTHETEHIGVAGKKFLGIEEE